MAKDKLFSTSNKQRTKQPAQVLRTTNVGDTSLQPNYDLEPFTSGSNTMNMHPRLPKKSPAPESPVHQRPKHVSVSPKNSRWQRKTSRPSAFTGLYARFSQVKRNLGH
jgi:hypothetical protein